MAKRKSNKSNIVNSASTLSGTIMPMAENVEVQELLTAASTNTKESSIAQINSSYSDNAQKHVSLEHLYIIKDYIDKGDRNSGGGGGVSGSLASAEIASDDEVNDLFKI